MTLEASAPVGGELNASILVPPPAESEQPPAETPPVEPAPEAAGQQFDAERFALLERIVATDPSMRAQYEMERFGVAPMQAPMQQPMAYPQQAQPGQPGQALPPPQQGQIPEFQDGYDPYNPQHTAQLVGAILQQSLAPFQEFIHHTQQKDVQYEQQSLLHQVNQVETQVDQLVNKQYPGYAEDPLLKRVVQEEFQNYLAQRYPCPQGQPYNPIWMHPLAHEEALSKIAPQVRQYYARLKGALPAQAATNTAMAREAYVEGSNAVVSQGNPFADAEKKGDILGMVTAIRKQTL
jgi:hypothetical protein